MYAVIDKNTKEILDFSMSRRGAEESMREMQVELWRKSADGRPSPFHDSPIAVESTRELPRALWEKRAAEWTRRRCDLEVGLADLPLAELGEELICMHVGSASRRWAETQRGCTEFDIENKIEEMLNGPARDLFGFIDEYTGKHPERELWLYGMTDPECSLVAVPETHIAFPADDAARVVIPEGSTDGYGATISGLSFVPDDVYNLGETWLIAIDTTRGAVADGAWDAEAGRIAPSNRRVRLKPHEVASAFDDYARRLDMSARREEGPEIGLRERMQDAPFVRGRADAPEKRNLRTI